MIGLLVEGVRLYGVRDRNTSAAINILHLFLGTMHGEPFCRHVNAWDEADIAAAEEQQQIVDIG